MQTLKYLGVGLALALVAYLFLKGVNAGAYSRDRTVGGALKSIFRRQPH